MEPTLPPVSSTPTQGTSMGVVLALIMVVGIVVVGAYYVWTAKMHDRVMAEAAALRELEIQSESTAPEAIEADLAAETPEEFSAELDAAFAELDAAMGAQ